MTGSAENERGYAVRGGFDGMSVCGIFWPSSRSEDRGGMEFMELNDEVDAVRRTGRFMKSPD